jgi:hypothetical protein
VASERPRRNEIMKATWAAAAAVVVGMMAGTGCARAPGTAVRGPIDLPTAASESSSIRVGESHVVNGHPTLSALRRAEAQGHDVERVVLSDGGYLLCWTTGTPEQGRTALAQSFNADGSSRGAPVVISRPEVDVMGTPHAVHTTFTNAENGEKIVATFAAAYESSIALVEVPLEIFVQGPKKSDVIAANR